MNGCVSYALHYVSLESDNQYLGTCRDCYFLKFRYFLLLSYAHIRLMVRYKAHAAFINYYNDIFSHVKAEVRSPANPQFGAFQDK